MRIDLFSTGLVDDLAGEVVAIQVTRVGTARYAMAVRGTSDVELELWTTRKDRVLVSTSEDPPSWVELALGAAGELVSLAASECFLHLEHLDRNLYVLGLSRGEEHWGFNLRAHGYIKVRVSSGGTAI
jgi:hypothetical protein